MVFTKTGKNRVRDLVDADLSYGELGSGTTAPLASDTDLVAGVIATTQTLTTQTSDKQITVDYNLPSTTAQGSTFTEFGLFNASSTLYARFLSSSLTHESTEQWQYTTRLFID